MIIIDSTDSETEMSYTPREIKATANNASVSLLPSKSLEIFENTYQNYHKSESFSNFAELSKNVKSSTL